MLDFSTITKLHGAYSVAKLNKLLDCNAAIKALTEKFAQYDVTEAQVGWDDHAEVDHGEGHIEMIPVCGGIYWDARGQKIMYRFEDHKPEVLAGCNAEVRLAAYDLLPALLSQAEQHLEIRLMRMIGPSYKPYEEAEDQALWQEPEEGGQSMGDELMTNGNRN